LNEFGKRVLLAFHDLCIAHQFVKPSLAGLRDYHAHEPGRLAGPASVPLMSTSDALPPGTSIAVTDLFISASDNGRQTELAAPAIDIAGQTAAFAGGTADVDGGGGAAVAGKREFGDEELSAGNFLPAGGHLPVWFAFAGNRAAAVISPCPCRRRTDALVAIPLVPAPLRISPI
jgi:hypothetical protein